MQDKKTFELHMEEPHFTNVKDGIKKVEGRLNKPNTLHVSNKSGI